MSEHAKKVIATQRLSRQQLDTDSILFRASRCWHAVPRYGGGGGSRYYGPSWEQCQREGVWLTEERDDHDWTICYCAQHARRRGLLDDHGKPIEGVERRRY